MNLLLAHTDLLGRLEGVCFGHVLSCTFVKHATVVDSVSIGAAFGTQHTSDAASILIIDVDRGRPSGEDYVLGVFCLLVTEVAALFYVHSAVVGPDMCLTLALFHV